MKKTMATIMTLIICVTLALTLALPASADNNLIASYEFATDGDLLYRVQFNQTAGCYKSHEISRDAKNTGVLSFSDDGYAVTVTLNSSDDKGRIWYGDIVDGLKLGEGYKYTIKYKIKNDNGGTGTGNNGFFFSTNVDATSHEAAYGAYGNLCKEAPSYSLFRAGTKIPGFNRCDGSNYVKFIEPYVNYVPKVDDDGFVDCQMEITGYKYYLYINGQLFDGAIIQQADIENSYFGIVFYTYSSGGTLKDVEIYKGLTLTEESAVTTTKAVTTTEEPVITTTEEITSADVTTTKKVENTTRKPEITTATPSAATAAVGKSCGGFTAAAQLAAILTGGLAFIVVRKKH